MEVMTLRLDLNDKKITNKIDKGVGIILNGKNINPFLARNGNDSKSHVKYKQTNKVAIHCASW